MARLFNESSKPLAGRTFWAALILSAPTLAGPAAAGGDGLLGTTVAIFAGFKELESDREKVELALDGTIVTKSVELESMHAVRGVLSKRGGRIVDASIDVTDRSIIIRFRERSRFKIMGGAFAGYIFVFPDLSADYVSGATLDVRYRLGGMTKESVSTDGNKVRINLAGRVALPFSVVRINFPRPVPFGV